MLDMPDNPVSGFAQLAANATVNKWQRVRVQKPAV